MSNWMNEKRECLRDREQKQASLKLLEDDLAIYKYNAIILTWNKQTVLNKSQSVAREIGFIYQLVFD